MFFAGIAAGIKGEGYESMGWRDGYLGESGGKVWEG